MPLYEFDCRQCGYNFTVLIPFTKKNDVTCPKCHSDNLKQKFSPFSHHSSPAGRTCVPSAGSGGG
ncbi:MAG: zinc ribbon domain-containing protein [Peptococcaceae bacterium]|nr:zinc ribbon domain-containing protein [Peptococcaceae bacterium]